MVVAAAGLALVVVLAVYLEWGPAGDAADTWDTNLHRVAAPVVAWDDARQAGDAAGAARQAAEVVRVCHLVALDRAAPDDDHYAHVWTQCHAFGVDVGPAPH
jgi:hypothetical protein